MSKPLIANPRRQSESAKFHRAVFAMFGYVCALCGGKGATDAAHVLNRGSNLGPLRYASPRFARPAHRSCHDAVDRHEIAWPLAMRQDAVRAFNEIAKTKMEVPTA